MLPPKTAGVGRCSYPLEHHFLGNLSVWSTTSLTCILIDCQLLPNITCKAPKFSLTSLFTNLRCTTRQIDIASLGLSPDLTVLSWCWAAWTAAELTERKPRIRKQRCIYKAWTLLKLVIPIILTFMFIRKSLRFFHKNCVNVEKRHASEGLGHSDLGGGRHAVADPTF